MFSRELIQNRIKELDDQYEQAQRQLAGLAKTIQSLKRYASNLVDTGDFTKCPARMSNEAWKKRASETIKELIRVDKKNFPTFNSVLVSIYIQLRNVYGVVLDQLRKDYKYKYDTLCYPSAFEAISDDDTIRDIFDSLLIGLFPDNYCDDEVLTLIEGGGEVDCAKKQPEEMILKIIVPLAIKHNDDSFGYAKTFDLVCDTMDCSWGNLQTRYMNKNNIEEAPSKLTIIVNNENVLRKFKKTVRILLEKNYDL